jgi:integrase/recombinase XerD
MPILVEHPQPGSNAVSHLASPFSHYLGQEKNLSKGSVKSYTYCLSKFNEWLQESTLSIEELLYEDLLRYIKWRRGKGDQKRYINQTLMSVRHYMDFLLSQNLLLYNPAAELYIRGVKRSIPHHLLDEKNLEQIYEGYLITDTKSHRNKLMLGLLIYQGLSSAELSRLKASHIDLQKGRITLEESSSTNGRILAMEAKQVILFSEYLLTIRPKILKECGLSEKEIAGRLFFTKYGFPNLTNSLFALMRELKKKEGMLKNAAQIRMSVITIWLQHYDVRVVQHMCGHRYVSSTERYQTRQLDTLQRELSLFHPLQRNEFI